MLYIVHVRWVYFMQDKICKYIKASFYTDKRINNINIFSKYSYDQSFVNISKFDDAFI